MAEFTEEQIKQVVRAAEELERTLKVYLRYDEEINLSGKDGTNIKEWDRVERGRLLRITHISAYDETSSPTRIRLGYWNRTRYVWVKTGPAPLTSESVEFNGEIPLTEGMCPAVQWDGVTVDDDLYAFAVGYWTKY